MILDKIKTIPSPDIDWLVSLHCTCISFMDITRVGYYSHKFFSLPPFPSLPLPSLPSPPLTQTILWRSSFQLSSTVVYKTGETGIHDNCNVILGSVAPLACHRNKASYDRTFCRPWSFFTGNYLQHRIRQHKQFPSSL